MEYAGLQLPDPAPEDVVLGAVVMIKLIDKDGGIKYREHKSPDLHPIEALGMATTFTDTLRAMIMRGSNIGRNGD